MGAAVFEATLFRKSSGLYFCVINRKLCDQKKKKLSLDYLDHEERSNSSFEAPATTYQLTWRHFRRLESSSAPLYPKSLRKESTEARLRARRMYRTKIGTGRNLFLPGIEPHAYVL